MHFILNQKCGISKQEKVLYDKLVGTWIFCTLYPMFLITILGDQYLINNHNITNKSIKRTAYKHENLKKKI